MHFVSRVGRPTRWFFQWNATRFRRRNPSVSHHWQICISSWSGGGKWIECRRQARRAEWRMLIIHQDQLSGSYWWRNESRSARHCRRKCDSPFSLSRTFCVWYIGRGRRTSASRRNKRKVEKNTSNAINFSFWLSRRYYQEESWANLKSCNVFVTSIIFIKYSPRNFHQPSLHSHLSRTRALITS